MRVLLAVEDENFGAAICDFVSHHGWKSGTMFKILHVVEPSLVGDQITAIYGKGLENEILEERTKSGADLIARLRDKLQGELGTAMPVEVSVVVGRPNHVILEVASEWKADMIVIGSHGRTGLTRMLLGSVSLSVLNHAKCSVTIVRLHAAAA